MSNLNREVTISCKYCGGTGKTDSPDAGPEPCIYCDGRGRVSMTEYGGYAGPEPLTIDLEQVRNFINFLNPAHDLAAVREEIERERLARKRDPARDDSKTAAAKAEIVRFWLIISQAIAAVTLLFVGIIALFNAGVEPFVLLLLLIFAFAHFSWRAYGDGRYWRAAALSALALGLTLLMGGLPVVLYFLS